MRKFLTLTLLLLSMATAGAQEVRFSCSFSLINNENGAVVMSGKALIQGDCYRCETAEGVMCSNGADRWIYNSATDELVIQKNDVSMFSDLDLSSIKGTSYSYVYEDFTVKLSDIAQQQQPWPDSMFVFSEDSTGEDTVVTDLR